MCFCDEWIQSFKLVAGRQSDNIVYTCHPAQSRWSLAIRSIVHSATLMTFPQTERWSPFPSPLPFRSLCIMSVHPSWRDKSSFCSSQLVPVSDLSAQWNFGAFWCCSLASRNDVVILIFFRRTSVSFGCSYVTGIDPLGASQLGMRQDEHAR